MKLAQLQKELLKKKIDAYLITRNNMFLGQDILDEENKIKELTNFTGSAGTLLVLKDKAVLFVDGRYDIQARIETNPEEVEINCSNKGFPIKLDKWLSKNMGKEEYKMLYNPWCHSIEDVAKYTQRHPNLKLIADNEQMLGSLLSSKVFNTFEHKIEFAGISREEKVSLAAKFFNEIEVDGFLFTAADSVSWLLNLRSNCLPDTPVVRAFALVDKEGRVDVFGDNLDIENIHPFSELHKFLKPYKNKLLGLDDRNTPQAILEMLPKKNYKRWADFCQNTKTNKNAVEIDGIKKAHLRDGTAVCKFLYWLHNNWQGKTELDIIEKLYSFRKSGENFYSNSFETIAGYGPNGAIVHYHSTPESNAELKAGSLLLLDSGAQYYDGTTDITRTIAIGEPSEEMIHNNTLVLKSHIALASAVFPERYTDGIKLDILARAPLWKEGKDYAHGTGHGVGCFLNVHEGPIGISSRYSYFALSPNMVTSIEPGYYKEGAYGIRIENLARIVEVEDDNFENNSLKFETLTFAPIDKSLINRYLLTQGEIEWLNDYHRNVFENIHVHLNDEEKQWLKDACSPL